MKLDTALSTDDIDDDTESSWKALHGATHSASVEVLGLFVCKYQNWLNDNTDVQQFIGKIEQLSQNMDKLLELNQKSDCL